ncbi:MAG TPA: D-glycerate dehydrogenase [Nitrospiraceae bacterium]|nr:D-glycerate dehydrogenase [Nitrospiraceae bacterium]
MMTRPALYVSRLLPEAVMAAIERRFHLIARPAVTPPSVDQLRDGLRAAEAAICTLTESIGPQVLSGAPNLRVVANYAVGYNNIDVEAANAKGIVVTNTPDVLTDATADLTWTLILTTARRVVEGDRLVRSGRWPGWQPTQLLGLDVSGRALGLIGMGRIGRAVAERAAGFHMQILYHTRHPKQEAEQHRAWISCSLEQVLSESDIVSLHVPLTRATTHLIGVAQLALMKPTAILINTARGPVVDEAALVNALVNGRPAGAGLDVYEQEPSVHPRLLELDQVVLAPHLGSATLTTRIRMGMICLENITAVLEGREPPNRVAT